MLRYAFLPSDFHPMVLILGDGPDIARLADLLRRFAAAPTEMHLGEDGIFAPSDTSILLCPGDPAGLRADGGADRSFVWQLDAATAASFAGKLAALSAPDVRAGSVILDCDGQEALPIKISRGEYRDDFLTDDDER